MQQLLVILLLLILTGAMYPKLPVLPVSARLDCRADRANDVARDVARLLVAAARARVGGGRGEEFGTESN